MEPTHDKRRQEREVDTLRAPLPREYNSDGRRARAERLRQLMVDTVYAACVQGEWHLSMMEVARRCRCSGRTVYQHYRNMRALRDEVIRQYGIELQVALPAEKEKLLELVMHD